MTTPSFATLRELARDDVVVTTKVNGRPLRFVASPVFEGLPPRVVWSDLLGVLRVGLFQRMRINRLLREKCHDQLASASIAGRSELTIPLALAGAMMASAPGMPPGLDNELERAVDAALSRAGEKVLAIMPTEGRA